MLPPALLLPIAGLVLGSALASPASAQDVHIHAVRSQDVDEVTALRDRVALLERELAALKTQLAHLHEHLHPAPVATSEPADVRSLREEALAELADLFDDELTVVTQDAHSLEGHVCEHCGEVHGEEGHSHGAHAGEEHSHEEGEASHLSTTAHEHEHGHEHAHKHAHDLETADRVDAETASLREAALAELADLFDDELTVVSESDHSLEGHVCEHCGEVHGDEGHGDATATSDAPVKKRVVARRRGSL